MGRASYHVMLIRNSSDYFFFSNAFSIVLEGVWKEKIIEKGFYARIEKLKNKRT